MNMRVTQRQIGRRSICCPAADGLWATTRLSPSYPPRTRASCTRTSPPALIVRGEAMRRRWQRIGPPVIYTCLGSAGRTKGKQRSNLIVATRPAPALKG